jgi:hypothetical protein
MEIATFNPDDAAGVIAIFAAVLFVAVTFARVLSGRA